MIDSAALAGMLPAELNVAPLAAIAAVSKRLPQFAPGQHVQATVVAQLADGRFTISIAGQPHIAALPQGVKPGQTLALNYLGNAPRLTFALDGETLAPEPLGATLSPTGRLIDSVLSAAPRTSTATIDSARALIPSPEAAPPQLAGALQHAIESSGLFYESHLARWAAGQFPIEQLRHEPQARFAPDLRGEAPGTPASAASGRPDIETSAAPPAPESQGNLPAEALPLIRSQLDAIENRQLIWQGEVWPGQTAQWHVADSGEESHPGMPQAHDSQTELRVTLPRLGELAADLRWGARGLSLAIHVHEGESALRLRENLGALNQAFDAAGLSLLGVTVQSGEAL